LRTSDLRTALDLGRFAPRPQAVASVDAFLNRERVTLTDLWVRARLLTRVRNGRRLRANLAVADAGAQSYAESTQRVLFVDAGLPRPTTQVPVYSPTGELLGFLDMGWLRCLLGSEYDGEEHHDDEKGPRGRRATPRSHRRSDPVDRGRGGQGRAVGTPCRPRRTDSRAAARPRLDAAEHAGAGQITRAQRYEAATGQPWQWLPWGGCSPREPATSRNLDARGWPGGVQVLSRPRPGGAASSQASRPVSASSVIASSTDSSA
jgi:hypothetical protein